MRNLFGSAHFVVAIGLAMLFWITAPFMDVQDVLLLTNSLMLFGGGVVAVWYLYVAIWAIIKDESSFVQATAVGLALGPGCYALWRVLSIFWITSGQPRELVNNYVVAFLQGGIALAMAYHIYSAGAASRSRPALRWTAIAGATIASVGLWAFLTIVEPDTSAFAREWVIPYLPR